MIKPMSTAAQDSKADETAIGKIVQEQVTAWNASDAVAYSRHFAEDGTFTNIRGEFYCGYEPFLKRHERRRRQYDSRRTCGA